MTTKDDIRAIVEQAILGQPRSQQTLIGPSEIGTECDRCLGHKLAGTEQRRDAAWLPYLGTAMHDKLENVVLKLILDAYAKGQQARWSTETRLFVGTIDGQQIHGNADLFDHQDGTSVDYKLVGDNTLKTVRTSGPSNQYRVQGHTYGLGWTLTGVTVNTVAIWYLPRNAPSLDRGVWWEEPYDETVALAALQRADALAQAIRIMGADSLLPTLERADGCYDCARYPSYPTDPPAQVSGPFADLAQPQQEGTLV